MLEFTNRESYLKAVAEWKIEYADVSEEIRKRKKSRKMYIKLPRPNNSTKAERMDNPLFGTMDRNDYRLVTLRQHAATMMEARKESKIEADRQWKAERQKELTLT